MVKQGEIDNAEINKKITILIIIIIIQSYDNVELENQQKTKERK